MVIQWFPGHMTKALRMMEKEIKVVDTVIYVLDSRAPFSCVNPKLNSLIDNKPIIYAFNKYDLCDKKRVDDWIKYFSTKWKGKCVTINSTASGLGKKIENAIYEVCKEKTEKYKAKNINVVLRAIVLGVPNCGKSTLINNLCGKGKTLTGNKAGVTKGKQWVRIGSGIELLDTPGTLWPAFNNNKIARNLAYIGSIKEEVVDIPELSLDFIRDILNIDKTILEKRYSISIDEEDVPLDILEKICESRKFLLKKGEYDYDRGAYALISDFKQSKISGITLESVEDIKELTKKDRVENE